MQLKKAQVLNEDRTQKPTLNAGQCDCACTEEEEK